METRREKTRNLSVAEYYAVLQKEYLIAEFRKKIYYSPKDRAYYERVMDHKREKISDIASRNNLDSIFTSPEVLRGVREELFDPVGHPVFPLTEEDQRHYFAVGNEFSYHGEIWTLEEVLSDGTLVLGSCKKGERVKVDAGEVCRIL